MLTPVEPKPAASVVLVRPGSAQPVELYMIRRRAGMRFLGGFYAFPGGKVAAADAVALARCRGLAPEAAGERLGNQEGVPSLAFWVAAIRELFEETGVLMAERDGPAGKVRVDPRTVTTAVKLSDDPLWPDGDGPVQASLWTE